jgi:hypothetical protein
MVFDFKSTSAERQSGLQRTEHYGPVEGEKSVVRVSTQKTVVYDALQRTCSTVRARLCDRIPVVYLTVTAAVACSSPFVPRHFFTKN